MPDDDLELAEEILRGDLRRTRIMLRWDEESVAARNALATVGEYDVDRLIDLTARLIAASRADARGVADQPTTFGPWPTGNTSPHR